MRALCGHGTRDIRSVTVPVPRIENRRDAIFEVTSAAICGEGEQYRRGNSP